MANPQQMKMMRQIQKMQADMAAAQEELAAATVEGSSGGGVVTVTVTGTGVVRNVRIDPSVVDPEDVEMLEDLVLAAVTDGLRRAQEIQQERMGAVTGGIEGALGGGLGGMLG